MGRFGNWYNQPGNADYLRQIGLGLSQQANSPFPNWGGILGSANDARHRSLLAQQEAEEKRVEQYQRDERFRMAMEQFQAQMEDRRSASEQRRTSSEAEASALAEARRVAESIEDPLERERISAYTDNHRLLEEVQQYRGGTSKLAAATTERERRARVLSGMPPGLRGRLEPFVDSTQASWDRELSRALTPAKAGAAPKPPDPKRGVDYVNSILDQVSQEGSSALKQLQEPTAAAGEDFDRQMGEYRKARAAVTVPGTEAYETLRRSLYKEHAPEAYDSLYPPKPEHPAEDSSAYLTIQTKVMPSITDPAEQAEFRRWLAEQRHLKRPWSDILREINYRD